MPHSFTNAHNLTRSAGLWFYRQATKCLRRDLWQSFMEAKQFPVPILFYHRVSNTHPTPWSISRDDFRRHLDWLQEHFEVVSLAESRRIIMQGENTRATVAITFDDGYAENCEFALPELRKRGLTATYFVATDFIEQQKYFPHDVELGLELPPHTLDEVKEIAQQGFEIGAHTRGHVDMGKFLPREQVEHQIVGSAQVLREWTGQKVDVFAFPYGQPHHTCQQAVDVLRDAGFTAFCTAYGAWNWPGQSAFHLRRIHADPGIESLKNWLSLDPRKLHETVSLPFVECPPPDLPARAAELSVTFC